MLLSKFCQRIWIKQAKRSGATHELKCFNVVLYEWQTGWLAVQTWCTNNIFSAHVICFAGKEIVSLFATANIKFILQVSLRQFCSQKVVSYGNERAIKSFGGHATRNLQPGCRWDNHSIFLIWNCPLIQKFIHVNKVHAHILLTSNVGLIYCTNTVAAASWRVF